MPLRADEYALEKINHLILCLKEAVEFASGTGCTDHNAATWDTAVHEMVALLAERGETWDIIELPDDCGKRGAHACSEIPSSDAPRHFSLNLHLRLSGHHSNPEGFLRRFCGRTTLFDDSSE